MFCSLQQRSHHDNSALQKTLVHLQFDFGVVNTMDNDCKQQVLSVTLHLQQLTTLAVRPQTNTQTDTPAPVLLADIVTTGNGLKNGVHCGL